MVLGDLTSSRKGQVCKLGSRAGDGSRVIVALAPLASLMGYSTALRTITSGAGSFSSSFAHYQPVSSAAQQDIVQQLRGYVL